VGGLAYLVYLGLKKYLGISTFRNRAVLFAGIYLFTTIIITPLLAIQLGRVPMPLYATQKQPIQPANWITCLMNRHYAKVAVKDIVVDASKAMGKEVRLVYLDANFPFWDGFPLLPHKSHDDGEKIDLAFIYQSKKNQAILNDGKGLLGYGVVEAPKQGEQHMPSICAKRGYWQYNLLEIIVPQRNTPEFVFSTQLNRQLLIHLATDKRVGKIFIEPHLKSRLGLGQYHKIRFHGCAAVRHDDHIHVQL